MKYVLAWTSRLGGTGKENEAAVRRALELLGKWKPPKGTKIHQFVGRLDAEGGFAVLETDNPAELLDGTGKFAPYNAFHVYPVVDIDEWAKTAQEGVKFRGSIS
jgi:hypothetical protein